jgi:hypothetical protein
MTTLEKIGKLMIDRENLVKKYEAGNKDLQEKTIALGEKAKADVDVINEEMTKLIAEEIERTKSLNYVETLVEEQK